MPSSDLDVLLFNTSTSTLSYINIGALHTLLNHYPGHQLFTQPIPKFTKKIDVVISDGSVSSGEAAGDYKTELVWLPSKIIMGRLTGKFKKLWIVTGTDDVIY